MIIITGVRFAGKVDAVPRIGHVATRFFHLYYVPLIPLGTFLITGKGDDSTPGIPLPLSRKSIVVGWLRSLGWVALVGGLIAAVLGLVHQQPGRVVLGPVAAVLAAGALWLLYRLPWIAQASYERAGEIVRPLALTPEQKLMLEVAYGRMSADQAERELLRIYEAADVQLTNTQHPASGMAIALER